MYSLVSTSYIMEYNVKLSDLKKSSQWQFDSNLDGHNPKT